jgi:hypothetical protein
MSNKRPKRREHFNHIKKKCFLEIELGPERIEKVLKETGAGSLEGIKKLKPKDVKKTYSILLTDSSAYVAFNYDNNGTICCIPLANPVLIYFNYSQTLLKPMEKEKKELLAIFRDVENITEDGLFQFYKYFGLVSVFVTQLTNSMEAFVNQMIRPDYVHNVEVGKRYTIQYNYDQIQRELSLETKIKDILNVELKKDFAKQYGIHQQHLDNLHNFRNDVVHTKTQERNSYSALFRASLNFNCLDTIYAVAAFINYYKPDLVEHCTCGRDI